jgi:hypothetical protein
MPLTKENNTNREGQRRHEERLVPKSLLSRFVSFAIFVVQSIRRSKLSSLPSVVNFREFKENKRGQD